MQRIDAHAHFPADHPDALALLDAHQLMLLNVAVSFDSAGAWRKQMFADTYQHLHACDPQHFAWCTAFDLPRFDDPHYIARVIERLQRDFEHGAVACKVWRNIGMNVRTPSGAFMLIDDPFLKPVFEYLASAGKPVLAHVGEPLDRWLDAQGAKDPALAGRRTPNRHALSTAERPDGCPGYWRQIEARDHLLELHPRLNVIGAHLATLDHDVAEIARRLDRYPNLAVDTSGRRTALACQDSSVVRTFIIAYQDRILWGMDQGTDKPVSLMTPAERARWMTVMRDGYRFELDYYETGGLVMVDHVQTQGLGLPRDVLDKLQYHNARAWYAL